MKPLLCFDIEGTGVDPALDRIVQIAWRIENEASKLLINPGQPIPQESVEVHGITDEMVNDAPTFKHVASALLDEFKGCDLLGFNLTNYDVPILWEEFYRCGIVWDLSDVRILDAGTLFKRREERSLTAALKFYDSELGKLRGETGNTETEHGGIDGNPRTRPRKQNRKDSYENHHKCNSSCTATSTTPGYSNRWQGIRVELHTEERSSEHVQSSLPDDG